MKMRPGRELDALVAEKVFGMPAPRDKNAIGEHGYWTAGDRRFVYTHPWSTLMAWAWEVVLKNETLFKLQYDYISDMWDADFGKGFQSQALTAPHAICLAALSGLRGESVRLRDLVRYNLGKSTRPRPLPPPNKTKDEMKLTELLAELKELEKLATPVPGRCGICGHVMPRGEEMFKYHGASGDCPAPVLARYVYSNTTSRNALPTLITAIEKAIDAMKFTPTAWRCQKLLKEWGIE